MVETSNVHLDALFGALSDQTRRAILLMLLEGDLTVKDIAAPFEMSLAAVSKHIQILAKAGLITQHKSGREKWCRLDPNALKPAAFWLESYGQFLDDSFDLLEQLIELQGIDTQTLAND
ncbi:MAG: metalloregulator ArsR/SmtB family transcription factor [Rhodobacteraceae bacterium]|nr:metalloregulator ArsR/SmtB family transcription factor [Paracoccaceae bacterium]